MAVTSFIPTLWSARLLHSLDKATVGTSFINRNYEGEIKEKGNTVKINLIGAVTIGNYSANTDMTAAQTLNTTDTSLVITESKFFNFQVDDVDKVQAAGDLLDAAMGRAAYGLADEEDTYIFSTLGAGRKASNVVTKTSDIYADILALGKNLDKENVSRIGRRIAVTPDVYAELLADKHFVENSDSALAIAKTGYIGMVNGAEVYMSNNLPSGVHAIMTVVDATTYADQLSEVEAYRPEARFADAVKGLHLYGAKVVFPEAIATIE